MASSRSPSPAAGSASEPSSPQLSPRSKLQAMLAAVDDNSDDDESGPIDVKALFKSADKSSILPKEAKPTTQADEDDDSSEDEDEIIRPRGRLASRMQADTTNEARDASKTPDDAVHHEAAQKENEDKEDDVSALPRRRMARPARSISPETAVDAEADEPPSPGLFVSPSKSTTSHIPGAGSDSENDFPADLAKSDRFKALVARKRQERLAKEAEEARKQKERAERMAETMPADPDSDDDVSDITDDDGGRQLTQSQRGPRAPRKASKKALEEMNRETQRLNRSLQLAHEAKTKKKISKSSLFERFNFKPEGAPVENKPVSSSRPSTPVSHQTDVEMGDTGTPPSSPPVPNNIKSTTNPSLAPTVPARPAIENDDGDDILDIAAALAHKGKGKAVATAIGSSPQKSTVPKPRRQVRVKLPSVETNLVTIDSDDELEITETKKTKVDTIFSRLPTREKQGSTSMNALRRLANLSSPPREPSNRGRKGKPSMTVAELQMSLQQRARAQAKLERERRVEYLRSKGINVQTEEERQKERDQVEDIVARARQEVEEIMERERDEAKQARKERRKNGEDDPLGWDDSDDDSFQASGDEEEPEIELSGSEEEEEEGNGGTDADGDEEQEPAANPMFEDEAEDGDSEEEETPKPTTAEDGKVVSDEEEDELPTMRRRRSKKQSQVVSDDDDDEGVKATPKRNTTSAKSPSQHDSGSPKIPTSVLRSATKSFIPGLPVPAAGPAGLGLTQIFAGTMDDSQAGPSNGSPQDFLPSLNEFPDSQFSATAGQSQIDDKVPNSQSTQNHITQGHDTETQGVQLHFTQSQGHGFDSLMQMDNTQMSELIEPTQDSGYQNFTPLKRRFVDAPHSTMDTVMLGGTAADDMVQESPLIKRKGKLRRRGEASLSISSLPPTDVPGSPSTAASATITKDDTTMSNEGAETAKQSAFRLMEKAAKRKKRREDKLKAKMSEAKEWVEQEADESEDEYAGLGGADGEDSSEDDEELAKEMIDDTAGNNVDEAKLAGFYADRERAADAAQVDKLFRDITTGMLRKRRRGGGGDGNDLDLSDSDDGGEAKRRMKRRQFAKMQKALFADERIGKIAENPRNAAFLKSIEDRGDSDDEWDFGENFAAAATDAEESGESQNQNQQQRQGEAAEAIPDSQPTTNTGRKRSRTDDAPRQPAPNARRTAAARDGDARPASLTEVRRSLSTLLDDPNTLISSSIIPATDAGDSEGEEGDGDGHRPSTSSGNKENTRRSSVAVVDRITLKRSSSSNLSSGSARLAFAAPSNAGAAAGSGSGSNSNNGTFKVPALLRKATTNSLISNSSAGSSASSSSNNNNNNTASGNGSGNAGLKKPGFGEEAKLKKTAGRGSGVNYFARETERRAAVAEAEKRREKRKWKGVEGQKKAVRGLFGSGQFE
ncbi:hypothetical protein SLS62_009050 [Diatrype stigma]|uniref:DNA replication checkpoint mediator MRC1 domain-containing protein n=1 Tax=Diatrype stigma TaxID=117547 RepID=A0AAN9UG30_9PEZI